MLSDNDRRIAREQAEREANLPEQVQLHESTDKLAKSYSKQPLVPVIISRIPLAGPAVDKLLSGRASTLFKADIKAQFEEISERVDSIEAIVQEFLSVLGFGDGQLLITQERDLHRLRQVYVPPVEWDDIVTQLKNGGFVTISGPPHIGKTSTGIMLAFHIREALGREAVVHLTSGDDLTAWEEVQNLVFLLDDTFGAVKFDRQSRADDFARWLRKVAENNTVILVSRSQVLGEVRKASKLGEDTLFNQYIFELRPEISYNQELLHEVLKKHLAYGTSLNATSREYINEEQSLWARNERHGIVNRLRFPHNIDLFCSLHLPKVDREFGVYAAIESSNDIKKAVCRWVEEQDDRDRWFVLLLALFPPMPRKVFDDIFHIASSKIGFQVDDISRLSKRNSAFVTFGNNLSLAHPSYIEALQEHLRLNYFESVGQFVDESLQVILEADLELFCACDAADYGWPRVFAKDPINKTFDIRPYLSLFSDAYRYLLDTAFHGVRHSVSPFGNEEATPLLINVQGTSSGELMIISTEPNSSSYFFEVASSLENLDEKVRNLSLQYFKQGRAFQSQVINANDMSQRSPQIHALKWIKDQLKVAIEFQTLEPSPKVAHLYLEQALENLLRANSNAFGQPRYSVPLPIDKNKSFGLEDLKRLRSVWENCKTQGPTGNYHKDAWDEAVYRDGRVLVAAELALNILAQHNITYEGSLFVAPDQNVWHNYPYSEVRMEALIEQSLMLFQESFRWMVENNFATLSSKFPHYRYGPLKIVGALRYSAFSSGFSRFELIYLPSDFKTKNGKQIELYIQRDESHLSGHQFPEFRQEVRERLTEARASAFWTESMSPTMLYYPLEHIERIYRWIKDDLEQALNWKNLGNSRWKQMTAEDSTHGALSDNNLLTVYDRTNKSPITELLSWKTLLGR